MFPWIPSKIQLHGQISILTSEAHEAGTHAPVKTRPSPRNANYYRISRVIGTMCKAGEVEGLGQNADGVRYSCYVSLRPIQTVDVCERVLLLHELRHLH